MGKKSELGAAERRDVVLMLLRREEAAAVLARRYGISEQTLYRWRDEFLAAGEAALLASQGRSRSPQSSDRGVEAGTGSAGPGDRRTDDRQPAAKKKFGRLALSTEFRQEINEVVVAERRRAIDEGA